MGVRDIVIIGGGLAASNAAESVRAAGFDGAVRLVAGEAHRPYERPPLSKGVLLGDADVKSVYAHDERWFLDNAIDLIEGTKVTGLDVAGRSLELDDGRSIAFGAALLATGATPRPLEVDGAADAGIHYLRTIEDSNALRTDIAAGGKRVVVVGGGWIGLEVAAAARHYGHEVTVLVRGALPLVHALGTEMAEFFVRLHRDNGVDIRVHSTTVEVTRSADGVATVATADGRIEADVVVAGIGASPSTALAASAGLPVDNGVLVDDRLRTAAAHVFAAGDVANPMHPALGVRLRSEHWANAIDGGKTAGITLAGGDAVFAPVPYFFTDQFDLGMEWAGYPPLIQGAQVVTRGDTAGREFVAFWTVDRRVVAGMNVNVWDVNDDIQALVRSGRTVDPSRLADGDVPIAEL